MRPYSLEIVHEHKTANFHCKITNQDESTLLTETEYTASGVEEYLGEMGESLNKKLQVQHMKNKEGVFDLSNNTQRVVSYHVSINGIYFFLNNVVTHHTVYITQHTK